MKTIELNGKNLTLDLMYEVAFAGDKAIKITLHKDVINRMQRSRDYVLKLLKDKKPIYGINTGFGALSSKQIDDNDLGELQLNLIRSHCTGVGKPFERSIVRAIMLSRVNCLIQGHSGVSIETVEMLLEFLYHGITPVIPEKGSVGASGDLAPLAHMSLALIGEGEVEYQGKELISHFVIDLIGKKPVVLGPKDGLALINGTTVMVALAGLACYKAQKLLKLADIISAVTIEAIKGSHAPFNPLISKLKPHPGQLEVTSNLQKLLNDSEIKDSHINCGKVQDPYSIRCIPQVHGAIRQTFVHLKSVVEIELNSVTDNPLIFPDEQQVISGGNFHGEALALAMDYLSMGITELCNISERRIEKMMNPVFSDLPPFLTKNSGLNSGLMIAHVTAAALASENKYLSHPASIDSIPTSTDKEDHVSMGVTAGRKLWEIIQNAKYCFAIEILCGIQALDFQKPLKPAKPLLPLYDLIRQHVTFIEKDRAFYKDIQKILNLIETNEIIDCVENSTGKLH
ncbi:MAG: histidine ammonia-lyase [Bacteriovoracaceae bacterium]